MKNKRIRNNLEPNSFIADGVEGAVEVVSRSRKKYTSASRGLVALGRTWRTKFRCRCNSRRTLKGKFSTSWAIIQNTSVRIRGIRSIKCNTFTVGILLTSYLTEVAIIGAESLANKNFVGL